MRAPRLEHPHDVLIFEAVPTQDHPELIVAAEHPVDLAAYALELLNLQRRIEAQGALFGIEGGVDLRELATFAREELLLDLVAPL